MGGFWDAFSLGMFVLMGVAWMLWNRDLQRAFDESGQEGEVGGVRVDFEDGAIILTVVAGELPLRVRLSAAQARRLVDLLRVAAAPGRTLAQARSNLRRGAAPKS